MSRTDRSGEGDTSERIMRSTHRALCEHGYASLTMQDIAAESDLSTAALHYHYDSKSDLLRAYLEYLLDDFRARARARVSADEDPFGRVLSLVALLFDPPDDDAATAEFRTALLELKAQAPYESRVRERLAAFDGYLREELADELRAARDAGTLSEDVDPDAVAEFVLVAASGAHTRRVALGRNTDRVERYLVEYLWGLRAEATGGDGTPATDPGDGGSAGGRNGDDGRDGRANGSTGGALPDHEGPDDGDRDPDGGGPDDERPAGRRRDDRRGTRETEGTE